MHLHECFVMSSKKQPAKTCNLSPDRRIYIDMNMYLRNEKRSRNKSTKKGGKKVGANKVRVSWKSFFHSRNITIRLVCPFQAAEGIIPPLIVLGHKNVYKQFSDRYCRPVRACILALLFFIWICDEKLKGVWIHLYVISGRIKPQRAQPFCQIY